MRQKYSVVIISVSKFNAVNKKLLVGTSNFYKLGPTSYNAPGAYQPVVTVHI